MNTIVTSSVGSINVRDVVRGAMYAFIGQAIFVIYTIISVEGARFSDIVWENVLTDSTSFLLAYLIANVFQRPKVVVVNPDKQVLEAAKEGKTEIVVKNKI